MSNFKFLNLSNFDQILTGCLLYITMTTTVYEMEIKKQLNSEFRTEQRIALVNLYERFVERNYKFT